MARSRASFCSAEIGFQQNSLDEFSTGGRKFITALNRNPQNIYIYSSGHLKKPNGLFL
jgi:hypothetical protein